MNTHTRRTRTQAVNPWIAMPKPPCVRRSYRRKEWVTETSCVCGATYAAFKPGVTFEQGALALRQLAKAEGDEGGGFRSVRPVLTMMRALKLQLWFEEHYGCCPFEEGEEDPALARARALELPPMEVGEPYY